MTLPAITLPADWATLLLSAVAGALLVFLWAFWLDRRRERARLAHLKVLETELDELREQRHELLREQSVAHHRLEHAATVEQLLQRREQELEQARREHSDLKARLAAAEQGLAQQRQAADEKMQLLMETRQQLRQEFESLANRIFEEKHDRFSKISQAGLEGTLKPLREQLGDFRRRVEDVYDRETREKASLRAELNQLRELNQRMSEDALNLTRALKGDNRAQGNWGEIVLERVLEESGLHRGREYETQIALKSGDNRRRPDVIVRLPEKRDIVIDAKVSLLHYERYCSSDDETERQAALKAHIASLRAHIDSLSLKDYENLEGVRSLDFVLIFIPVEAAFLAALEADQNLFRQAYDKNIIVVSPTTLLATLRTVQSIWRYERQNRNAEEIARQAGALHDKFAGFVTDLDDVGKHLERAMKSQNEARGKLSEGRGNLLGRVRKLETLGAKAKKALPDSQDEPDDEDDESSEV